MAIIKKIKDTINFDGFDNNISNNIDYNNKVILDNSKNNKVEEIDLSQNSYTISQDKVLDSIESNFSNNREVTSLFNQELYSRLNEEIGNLARDEGDIHRVSRR